jgi:gas vesicle protein
MEEATMASETRGGNGFSWFLAGLGLGSLLGVLYAPKAGDETREELLASALGQKEYLRQRSQYAAQRAGDYVERGKDQVNDYVAKGKGQVNQYVSKGKDAVETGRQKINEAYSQSVQAVAEQKEKIAASYAAGKQAYEDTTVPYTQEEELIPKSEHLS